MAMLWILLALPLAAATDCTSSYKSGITDLKSVKDAKEVKDSDDIVGKQISTADYTPVSLAGLPADVGCDADDRKAYIFKLSLDVGDKVTFAVHNAKGTGSWQIRYNTGHSDVCHKGQFVSSRCLDNDISPAITGNSPKIYSVVLQPAQNDPMNLWWVYTKNSQTTNKALTQKDCGELDTDCTKLCANPKRNCIRVKILDFNVIKKNCGCPGYDTWTQASATVTTTAPPDKEGRTTKGGNDEPLQESTTLAGKACDDAKDGYLASGSSLVDSLAECSQSCQKSAQCKSVTFFHSAKWCSHYSTICDNLETNSGTTSVIFQSANQRTTRSGGGSGPTHSGGGSGPTHSGNAKTTTGGGSGNAKTTTGGGSGNAKTTTGGGSGNAKTTTGGGSGDAKTTAASDDGSPKYVEDTGCVFETKVVVYALAMFSTALLV